MGRMGPKPLKQVGKRIGAGERDRTAVFSLEVWRLLNVVNARSEPRALKPSLTHQPNWVHPERWSCRNSAGTRP